MGHQQVEVGGHPLEWGHVLHGIQVTVVILVILAILALAIYTSLLAMKIPLFATLLTENLNAKFGSHHQMNP